MKKVIALIKAFLHYWNCFGDIVLSHKEKANQNLPVSLIYCEKCNKVFYEKGEEE